MEAVAYSTDGAMRCRECGTVSSVPEPLRTAFNVVEGTSVLVGAIFSIFWIAIWPFIVAVLAATIIRVVVAPRFAKPSSENIEHSFLRRQNGKQPR